MSAAHLFHLILPVYPSRKYTLAIVWTYVYPLSGRSLGDLVKYHACEKNNFCTKATLTVINLLVFKANQNHKIYFSWLDKKWELIWLENMILLLQESDAFQNQEVNLANSLNELVKFKKIRNWKNWLNHKYTEWHKNLTGLGGSSQCRESQ